MTFRDSRQPYSPIPIGSDGNAIFWMQSVSPIPTGMTPVTPSTQSKGAKPPTYVLYRTSSESCSAVALQANLFAQSDPPLPQPFSSLKTLAPLQDYMGAMNRYADVSLPFVREPRTAKAPLPRNHRSTVDFATSSGQFSLKAVAGQDDLDVVQQRLALGPITSVGPAVSIGGGPQNNANTLDTSGFQSVASACYGCYDFRSEDTALFQPASSLFKKGWLGSLQANQFAFGRYAFSPVGNPNTTFPYDSGEEVLYASPDNESWFGARSFTGTTNGGAAAAQHSVMLLAGQFSDAHATLGVSGVSSRLAPSFDPSFTGSTLQRVWDLTSSLKSGEFTGYFELGREYGPIAPSQIFSDRDSGQQNRVVALSVTHSVTPSPAPPPSQPCAGSDAGSYQLTAGWHDVGGNYVPVDGTQYTYYGLKGPTLGGSLTVGNIDSVGITAQATRGSDPFGTRLSDTIVTAQLQCVWDYTQQNVPFAHNFPRLLKDVLSASITPAVSYENLNSDAAIWGRAQSFNNSKVFGDAALRDTWLSQVQANPSITFDYIIGSAQTLNATHELQVTLAYYVDSDIVLCDVSSVACKKVALNTPSGSVMYASNTFMLNAAYSVTAQLPGTSGAPQYEQQFYQALARNPHSCITGGISYANVANSADVADVPKGVTYIGSLDVPLFSLVESARNSGLPDLLMEYEVTPKASPAYYARMRFGLGTRYHASRCPSV